MFLYCPFLKTNVTLQAFPASVYGLWKHDFLWLHNSPSNVEWTNSLVLGSGVFILNKILENVNYYNLSQSQFGNISWTLPSSYFYNLTFKNVFKGNKQNCGQGFMNEDIYHSESCKNLFICMEEGWEGNNNTLAMVNS